jgi:hypothetical protein
MSQTFENYFRERRARIAQWLSQGSEADSVSSVCETWVRNLVDSGFDPSAQHEFPALQSLVISLSNAGLRAYSDALDWLINTRVGVEPAEAPFIAHALAVASGRAYASYGADRLHWIGQFVPTIDSQTWEAFADSAAAVLRENADRRAKFLEFLESIIKEANEAPDRVTAFPPGRTSMAEIVEHYRAAGSFQEVWQADLRPVHFRWGAAFEILRRVEPERFLAMIDKLPHPTLVKQCLSHRALIEGPEEVLLLLRSARSSFDIEGRW